MDGLRVESDKGAGSRKGIEGSGDERLGEHRLMITYSFELITLNVKCTLCVKIHK